MMSKKIAGKTVLVMMKPINHIVLIIMSVKSNVEGTVSYIIIWCLVVVSILLYDTFLHTLSLSLSLSLLSSIDASESSELKNAQDFGFTREPIYQAVLLLVHTRNTDIIYIYSNHDAP